MMLPALLDDAQRAQQQQRPSLPGIRELFGDLARPKQRPAPFPLPSPLFSLGDLGSTLPTHSRPVSPLGSQGQTSPKSTWSPDSDHLQLLSFTRRHSDISSSLTPSTPSTTDGDRLLELPSISSRRQSRELVAGYSVSALSSPSVSASSMRPSTIPPSSRLLYQSHARTRSASSAITRHKSDGLDIASSSSANNAIARRRHTIGVARSYSPVRFASDATAPLSSHMRSPFPPILLDSPDRRRASLTRQIFSLPLSSLGQLGGDARRFSPPLPAAGNDAPAERRKTPAKYRCEYCGKRFNRPSSLKIHNNTHTGEKPFVCPVPSCGRHFSVMSNMRRHARVHGETLERTSREGSEESLDGSSSHYSSASSTQTTPIIPRGKMANAAAFGGPQALSSSASSSANSSPYLGYLSSSLGGVASSSRSGQQQERRRSLFVQKPYAYSARPSPSSDEESYLEL